MQELEKILEEIEQRESYLKDMQINSKKGGIDIDLAVGYRIDEIREIKDIIRKHMNDGWILVEERLPEDGQSVLCTDGKYAYLVEYDADLDAGFCDMDDIIAWQPLPEPYRPERSERE